MADHKADGVIFVSIHAPVRGATLFVKRQKNIELVSIHAPVRGATQTEVWMP